MSTAMQNSLPSKSLDRRIAMLAAKRNGIFAYSEAVLAGATRNLIARRVTDGRWERIFPGVFRLAGVPATWRQMLAAACLLHAPVGVASFRSAGALFTIAGLEPGPVEISVPVGRRKRCRNVTVHEVVSLGAPDIAVLDAIPVTTPSRTLIDLARVLSRFELEIALDDALRRRLTTIPRMQRRLKSLRRSGMTGVAMIEELLNDRDERNAVPESPIETDMLRLLTDGGLPKPVCQYVIVADGFKARTDFAYPQQKVAIEVDGYASHSGRIPFERDRARGNALTLLGWDVLHFTASDLKTNPDGVVRMVAEALGISR